jgi:hypothetical protein
LSKKNTNTNSDKKQNQRPIAFVHRAIVFAKSVAKHIGSIPDTIRSFGYMYCVMIRASNYKYCTMIPTDKADTEQQSLYDEWLDYTLVHLMRHYRVDANNKHDELKRWTDFCINAAQHELGSVNVEMFRAVLFDCLLRNFFTSEHSFNFSRFQNPPDV